MGYNDGKDSRGSIRDTYNRLPHPLLEIHTAICTLLDSPTPLMSSPTIDGNCCVSGSNLSTRLAFIGGQYTLPPAFNIEVFGKHVCHFLARLRGARLLCDLLVFPSFIGSIVCMLLQWLDVSLLYRSIMFEWEMDTRLIC